MRTIILLLIQDLTAARRTVTPKTAVARYNISCTDSRVDRANTYRRRPIWHVYWRAFCTEVARGNSDVRSRTIHTMMMMIMNGVVTFIVCEGRLSAKSVLGAARCAVVFGRTFVERPTQLIFKNISKPIYETCRRRSSKWL